MFPLPKVQVYYTYTITAMLSANPWHAQGANGFGNDDNIYIIWLASDSTGENPDIIIPIDLRTTKFKIKYEPTVTEANWENGVYDNLVQEIFDDLRDNIDSLRYIENSLNDTDTENSEEKDSKEEDLSDFLTWAEDPETPYSQLLMLSEHPDANIRHWVAMNPTVTEDILAKLMLDPSTEVRIGVSQSENVTRRILEYLSHDETYNVRLMVMMNSRLSKRTFKRLLKDEELIARWCFDGVEEYTPEWISDSVYGKMLEVLERLTEEKEKPE